MLAEERRCIIKQLIQRNGNVTVSELTALFSVSSETLRKDLLRLEKGGILLRTHGGALRKTKYEKASPLSQRMQEHLAEKRELCEYATRYIKNGDVLALDEGSTGAELARLLVCMFQKLTVVTSSLEIFQILSENSGFDIILCGGHFYRNELAFAGHLAISAINQLHFDKCFLFPSAISLKCGIMNADPIFIELQRAYIEHSDRVFVLAYSERFESTALYLTNNLDLSYTYITDSELPQSIYEEYMKNHINIIKE